MSRSSTGPAASPGLSADLWGHLDYCLMIISLNFGARSEQWLRRQEAKGGGRERWGSREEGERRQLNVLRLLCPRIVSLATRSVDAAAASAAECEPWLRLCLPRTLPPPPIIHPSPTPFHRASTTFVDLRMWTLMRDRREVKHHLADSKHLAAVELGRLQRAALFSLSLWVPFPRHLKSGSATLAL